MYLWITLKSKGDWAQANLQGNRRCSVLKRLWYSLVELPEIPSVVWIQGSSRRRKTFRWLKGLRCKLVGLHGVVGSKGKSNKVIDSLASSPIKSQGGDCCESDSTLEKLRFLQTANSGPEFALFFQPGNAWKIGARMEEFGVRTVEIENIIVTYFLGWICSNFMRGTFTINIDIVSV